MYNVHQLYSQDRQFQTILQEKNIKTIIQTVIAETCPRQLSQGE